jgi:ABC-2 type transport system permease protein
MGADASIPVMPPSQILLWAARVQLMRAVGFIRKDMMIAVSYRLQFLFQFTRVFFKLAVIYFIGRMLESSGGGAVLQAYGTDYFSFALVGLAVNNYLQTGLVTITNDIRQTMNQGILETLCATPVGYGWLLLYMTLWPFLFETLRIGCYFLIGMLVFGMRLHHVNGVGCLLTMGLTIPIFLMLGIISSSILIVTKRGDPINWFFTGISGILAGTMFPISVLPDWLQSAALCLPLTHSLEALRRCLLAGASARDISTQLVALAAFATVLLPVTLMTNAFCMAAAKKTGAFSTF